MEAVGYFRDDTGQAVNEALLSLEEQEAAFFAFCKDQGFRPLATFIDTQSAGPEGRRGYRQLSEYLQQPGRGFTVVVLPALAALAPGPKETVRRLLELEYLGARVVATEDAGGDLLEEALAFWRQRRNQERLSDRAMETLRSKAMRGYGLGKTPYGYHIGGHGRLEVVPGEAQVVRQTYGMYVEEGLGLRRIARYLNDSGIVTRRGSRWSVVTVRDILRNRVYIGTYARFGVRVPGSHEAIIGQDLFRQAQRKREGASGGRPPGRQTAFLLTGLAYCGYCQGRMIGVSRRQSWSRKRDGGETQAEYRYYRCGSRVNQSVCDYHTWRDRDLEQAVLEGIGRRLSSPETSPLPSARQDPRASLKSRLRSLGSRLERNLENAGRGHVSPADLRGAALPIIREIQRLEARSQELDRYPQPHSARIGGEPQENALELLERWPQYSFEDQRLYLSDLLEQVVVYDDRVEPVFHG